MGSYGAYLLVVVHLKVIMRLVVFRESLSSVEDSNGLKVEDNI